MVQLENDRWQAAIRPKGAELCSLINKQSGRQLLWSGDPRYWHRQAPILFPIIGGLKNGQYTFNGKTYQMGKHGFCRDALFQTVSASATEAVFQYSDTPETLKHYPFPFRLTVRFELTAEGLIHRFEVSNTGNETLFFCLGGHPAFNLPMEDNLQFEDYKIRFEKNETAPLFYLKDDLLAGKIDRWLCDQSQFSLQKSLFDNDALIFHRLNSKVIYLESAKGKSFVKFNLGSFPMVGIWTKAGGAPFLCVEPWYGADDDQSTDGDFTRKWEIQSLAPGETHHAWFSVSGV